MKTSSIFLLVAFFSWAHAGPTTKEEDNYHKELLQLYNWTKTEFKPLALIMLNITCQAGHNVTEDPRLYEGQDPAIIQPFVDKMKKNVRNFEEAQNHADSEDLTELAMKAFKNANQFKWKEGLTESAEEHLDSIKQESFRKSIKVFEAALEKPSKEFYDRFVASFDETISKLTPSEKEAHPNLTRWRDTKKSNIPNKLLYFNHIWEFLYWTYDELNGAEPDSE